MKKIFFLFLLIPALAQAQGAGIAQHHGIFWDTMPSHFGINAPSPAQLPVMYFGGKTAVVGTCDTIVPEDFVIQNPG